MRLRTEHICLGFAIVMLAGCNTDMWIQPKTEPYRESDAFPDGQSARPLVPGTIPRGYARLDEGYFTGQIGGKWLKDIPVQVTMDLLKRGQERFNIYCSPCHSRIGDGQGMISKRGFDLRRPVGNYHTDRLRAMPAGHFYDVITNGYGAMFSYASRVEPADRWAIVAYIRALQLSQHAGYADLGVTGIPGTSGFAANPRLGSPGGEATPTPQANKPQPSKGVLPQITRRLR